MEFLLLIRASGAITYRPQEDFNGTDEFKYSVTAAGKSVTQNATVAITVNAVNDAPTFDFETPIALSKADMLFESNQTFRVQVSDKDNSLDELTYDLLVGINLFLEYSLLIVEKIQMELELWL